MAGIVVFSRDPGATQRLVALIDALRSDGAAQEPEGLARLRAEAAPHLSVMRVFARLPGETMWSEAGYSPERWSGRDDESAEQLLRDTNAGLLMTGTSDIDEPTDRALWRAARKAGITSHTILDQRVNLAQRFLDADGSVTYPDWIYVRDDVDAQSLCQAGVTAPVRIAGDLHLRRLARRIEAISDEAVLSLRREWGVERGRRVIVFASECGREMAAMGRTTPYDEIDQLERLVAGLEAQRHPAGADARPNEIVLVVRPHPRDAAGKYSAFDGMRPSGLRVCVSAAGTSELAIKASDLIVGMNSSMLHDAAGIGRPVLSLTGAPIGDVPGALR